MNWEEKDKKIREGLNRIFKEMGFDVPDKIKPRKVVVHDDNGEIIKDYWLGRNPEETDDG